MLIHGDIHDANVLRGANGLRVIDPLGVIGDVACDLAPALRNPRGELYEARDVVETTLRRAELFSRRIDVDSQRLVDWAFVETARCVASGIAEGQAPHPGWSRLVGELAASGVVSEHNRISGSPFHQSL